MAQKLIIDADPGIGDAFAILAAFVDPSIELLALTATSGSVSGQQATRNLQFLTDLIDPLKHPRIGSAVGPVANIHGQSELPTIHDHVGNDGLGDVLINVPDLHNRRESPKLLIDLVREFPHEVRILTLGPLSNLIAAAELDPEFPALVESVVVHGGVLGVGDVSPVAEFNFAADPIAAETVLNWPTPCCIVPLDPQQQGSLTFEDVDALTDLIGAQKNSSTLTSLLQYECRTNHRLLGQEGISLSAVSALAVACRAESFQADPVIANVETAGLLTTGMLVMDRRSRIAATSSIDVVTKVDGSGVVDYFSRSLRRAAG